MKSVALLIGSDYGDLPGVSNDLAMMDRALRARGFTTRICPPAEATRAGILTAYEKLIVDTESGDAVVVYYSGHGGFAAPSGVAAHRPVELQFIVPVDYVGYNGSNDEDFRGVASVELSALHKRLTTVTRNVTVILDCCHSGLMARDSSMVVRAVLPPPYAWVRAHLDRLERQGLRVDSVGSEGNPDAVRIVACAPEQRAYSYVGTDDEWIGVFTESLTQALTETRDAPVTWMAVVDRVRQRVVDLRFTQRPEAEGPADRLLFTTERDELLHSLPVTPLDLPGWVRLDCAALLRVQDRDEFMIMPAGQPRADAAHRVGDLTITEVSTMSAVGPVTFAPGQSEVPIGARAFRTKVTAPQIAVRVPVGHPRVDQVLDALRAAALARPARPGEQDWAIEVRIGDDGLEVCDHRGPLHPPYPDDPQGLRDLAAAIKIIAQATELRRLIGDKTYPLDADVTIEWGLVQDGAKRPLLLEDEVLKPGQRIYVTVRNAGEVPIYVSLLDIGVSGRISLVNPATPGGQLLPKGRDTTLGRHYVSKVLTGVELSWPKGLDTAHARPETILVVLTSEPQDLRALEQPAIVQSRSAGRDLTPSPLQNIVDQLSTGRTRDIKPDTSSGVRYDIRGIHFRMQLDRP